jgi:hypothetical protein
MSTKIDKSSTTTPTDPNALTLQEQLALEEKHGVHGGKETGHAHKGHKAHAHHHAKPAEEAKPAQPGNVLNYPTSPFGE